MNATRFLNALAALAIFASTATAQQNIDVSTLPQRDTVQLTIYNSEDLTLVRETRRITFAKGVNPLQFSWANTLIDPTSVDLRFRSHGDKLDILDTTFPHDKPQMLYWSIQSGMDGEAVVEITYFTSGISWEADYVCTSDAAEEQMGFDGFVKIRNHSGEDYPDAQVRLVVGEINLVEKIADLARRGIITANTAVDYEKRRPPVARMAGRAREELSDEVMGHMSFAEGGAAGAPKEIIKEGLSEYFIYTVEGAETVPNGWSKRLRLFQGKEIPFRIVYRWRPAEYGSQLVRLFILRNDTESDLGTTPLPDGMVRLFRVDDAGGLSYLTQYYTKYVPIGQEIELNLGVDPEVIHERHQLSARRDNYWFHSRKARKYYSPDHGERIEPDYTVAGWDEHIDWVERIRNYRDKPITVEIRLTFPGHVLFISELNPKLYDFQSPEFQATIPARTKRDLAYTVTTKNGYNGKQSNVTLQ